MSTILAVVETTAGSYEQSHNLSSPLGQAHESPGDWVGCAPSHWFARDGPAAPAKQLRSLSRPFVLHRWLGLGSTGSSRWPTYCRPVCWGWNIPQRRATSVSPCNIAGKHVFGPRKPRC